MLSDKFISLLALLLPMPEPINVSKKITLELIEDIHAEPLLALLNANRQHLAIWLPWVGSMQTVEDFRRYISYCKKQHGEGTDYGYVITFNDVVAGRIGLHYVHQQNKTAAIGYWLGEAFQGNGIITQSCIALINYGFTSLGLHRIEIKCGTGNYKSAAIAERLQFTKEGTLRQAEWVNGKPIDLSLYSMLKEEWTVT